MTDTQAAGDGQAAGAPRAEAAELARLGARLDFRECGPCGGACCTMPWAVFATRADLERLVAWLRHAPEAAAVAQRLAAERGKTRAALDASDVAELRPLPEWERAAYGEGNLLWPRVAGPAGEVPQLRKDARGCVFLEEDGRCGAHAAKPILCRLFPYYYEAQDGRLARIVDRGHAGNCPITLARIDEVAAGAGDALDRLFAAYERDLADHATVRGILSATWPRLR